MLTHITLLSLFSLPFSPLAGRVWKVTSRRFGERNEVDDVDGITGGVPANLYLAYEGINE